MSMKLDTKKLCEAELRRLEAQNVDFYVDIHLKQLKQAMDKEDDVQRKFHTAQLMKLAVARYKIDPKHEVANIY